MNKARRKVIKEIKDRVETAKQDLEDVLLEEQEYYDNIPENLQGSERAEASEEAIGNLEEAVDALDNTMGLLEGVL